MNQSSKILSLEQFNKLFPFFILIDHQLKIQSFGKSIGKLCIIDDQALFTSIFRLKRPEFEAPDFEDLKALIGQMIILESKGKDPFILRGQLEYLKEHDQIYFVGSPWFDSIDQVKSRKLTIHDFAIHDPVIDLLHVLKTQKIATDEIKELLLTVQRQKNNLKGINELAANLLEKDSLDEIAWTIIENTISRFDLEDCVIYLVDQEEQNLIQIAAYGTKQSERREVLDPIKIKIGEGIVGKVALTGKPLIIADTSKVPEYIVDDKIRYSELTVPIIASNKVIGIIDSEHSEKNFFTKQHLLDFATIANLTAIKIKNAHAQEKQALIEKALEENRKRYEMIVERASEIIYELNDRGNYTYANPVFFKKTGYSMEELEKMHFLELVKESDREKVKAFYHNQFTQKIAETYMEMPTIIKGGKEIWIGQNVNFRFKKDGSIKDIIAVARDITEKKLAEIALQRSEEKYRGIIANMELGILEVDLEEKIQYVNQSFCKMIGFSSAELLGKVASEVLLLGKHKNMMTQKNKLRKDGVSDAYEIELLDKNNETKWWLISGAPYYDNNGKLIGSIGIHLDISKQKNLEKDLKKAKQIAEESSKAKEYFLANMSHEIRTPLNAIIGMVRELERSGLDPKQSSYANNADTAAEHLLSIINNILDMSKIETGEFQLEERHFSLSEVIEETRKIMAIKAKEKSLELNVKISDNIQPAHIGDPARIRQILINLLGNAIKFTEEGSVTLNCQPKTADHNSQQIHITITDTGIGIDKTYFKNIFKKFSQEDKSTARKYGGTGLGMAITYELIQLMKGEINISSKKGKGTSLDVFFTLPIGDLTKTKSTNTTSNFEQLTNKKILLVEDNEMNRLVATNTLSHFDVQITEAVNGKEAIKKIKEETFDIILMDIQMPIMDGIEATKIIRNELNIQTPIIALTANAFKKQIDLCLAAGMNEYVTKPFDEDTFLRTLLKVNQDNTNAVPGQILEKHPDPFEEKLYDLSALQETSRGNNAFIEKMIRLFIDIIPDSVLKMRNAFEEKDFDTLHAIAHRIKPSINNLGIDEIKVEIKQIEHLAAEDPRSNQLPLLLEKTETVLSEVIKQLKKELV